jgi:hypothetical protein
MKQARHSGRLGLWTTVLLTAVSVVVGGCGSGTPTSSVGVSPAPTSTVGASATPSAKPALITPSPSIAPTPARQTFVETKGSSRIVPDAVAVALQDGRVLLNSQDDGQTDIYDPNADSFTATGRMKEARREDTVTLLRDGRVLFAGGMASGSDDNTVLDSAELYDPTTGTFSYTAGRPVVARAQATATLLSDGRVLIVGGLKDEPSAADPWIPPLASAEIFDPATDRFTLTGSLEMGRVGHGANLLPDGDILITGGNDPNDRTLAGTELYRPDMGKFTRASSMTSARCYHAATTLADGRILIAGGYDNQSVELATAEIYDPATGQFIPTGSLSTPRNRDFGDVATRLLDGSVLMAGYDRSVEGNTAEVYQPASGAFRPIGPLPPAYSVDAAVLLPSGLVFIVMSAGSPTGAQALTLLYRP